jgi:1-aminocyclopropane-1-carboxylate deaminase/D-cysteine desulfhydrase-like pyridoxal-dependent ACC family enzyme
MVTSSESASDSGRDDPLARLLDRPRVRLAHLPTPILSARRLAADLGVEDILVKMDAETGFALGGNKVRKLEYELAPDRMRGVTCLVTAGGHQSNHCRVTAAFAARYGLRCVLVLNGDPPDPPTGNALLHRLFGAEIRSVPDRAARAAGLTDVAAEVGAAGGRALVVPLGASTGVGCLGYARAAHELVGQLDAFGPRPDRTLLFVPSSSGGTLAGLLLGLALMGRDDVVPVAVSADAGAEDLRRGAIAIAREGADLLGAASIPEPEHLHVVDTQVGEGYGIPTAASVEATERFGRLAGIVLDPTYTAKAAAGMMAWIRERGVGAEERIVFLHTGGHPALLAGGSPTPRTP